MWNDRVQREPYYQNLYKYSYSNISKCKVFYTNIVYEVILVFVIEILTYSPSVLNYQYYSKCSKGLIITCTTSGSYIFRKTINI